jgi:hypothetical protein
LIWNTSWDWPVLTRCTLWLTQKKQKKTWCCAHLRPWSWWPQSLFVWIRRHDKWSRIDCCKYETLFESFFDRSLQGKAEKQAIKKGASHHVRVINECASGLILCCIWLLSLLPYNFYIEICCMRCFKQALNDRKVNTRQNVFVTLLPCQFHMLSPCAFSLSYPIAR